MNFQNNKTFNNETVASTAALDLAEEDEPIMSLIQVLARVMSLFSVIGSCYILFNLAGTKTKRTKSMRSSFNRLLVALCISDVVGSLAMSIGNWAVPTSPTCEFQGDLSQEIWDIYYPAATGNDETCTTQGFFVQVGILGSALFTCFITLQTVLIVVFRCREALMKRVEIACFVLGVLAPLATATYGSVIGSMSPTISGYCWIGISPFPRYIMERYPPNEENCGADTLGLDSTRQSRIFRTFFLVLGWIMAIFLIVVISMIVLFCFVRTQERQASRWSQNAQQGRRQKRVLAKALPYIFMYPLIWFPTLRSTFGKAQPNIQFHLLASVLLPIQGFLNSLVYAGIVDKCLRKFCCCCTWCLTATPAENRNPTVSTSYLAGRSFRATNSNESLSVSIHEQPKSSEFKRMQDNKLETVELGEEQRTKQGRQNSEGDRQSNGETLSNTRDLTGVNIPIATTCSIADVNP